MIQMRQGNYARQAKNAMVRFLTYDQNYLIRKFHLQWDEDYLYMTMLHLPYRLNRRTGMPEKLVDGTWQKGDSFNEVLTLFDILCDSRDDRSLAGKWVQTQNFGHLFHRALTETSQDLFAQYFDRQPERLIYACRALGGVPIESGDLGFAIELLDGLSVALQFWHSDEEFPAAVRWFWDANALQYLRYETMYYAIGMVKARLMEKALQYDSTAV